MKHLLVLIFMGTMLSACFFEEIKPQDIVGKWTFTGFTQELERDGITWSPWEKKPNVGFISFCEFKSDGKFDYAPRSTVDSCVFGERYTIKAYNSSIIVQFTDFKPSNICIILDGISYPWVIHSVSSDAMILAIGSFRAKYARIK